MDHAHMMSKLVRRGKPEMQPAPMAKVLAGSFHFGRTASHRSRSSRSSSINLSSVCRLRLLAYRSKKAVIGSACGAPEACYALHPTFPCSVSSSLRSSARSWCSARLRNHRHAFSVKRLP